MFKRRPGTSGIRGQLYETKLMSLILYRLLHKENIESFYLASNIDGIGAFDDICFKINIKGNNRPLVVFIQAKHRENNDTGIYVWGSNNLIKYFDSYLRIKEKFSDEQGQIFEGNFDENECVFVIYTTENGYQNVAIKDPTITYLNDLIATGEVGTRPIYTEENTAILSKLFVKDEIVTLARRFAKFVNSKTSLYIMNDTYILKYHVVLAKYVLKVQDPSPEGNRLCTFREIFFCDTNEAVATFRTSLYQEIIKLQKGDHKKTMNAIQSFILAPSEMTLQAFIGTVIRYTNGQIVFATDNEDLKGALEKLNFTESKIRKSVEDAAKGVLDSLGAFKVPNRFGNIDLQIRGNQNKIETRLEYLTTRIVSLIHGQDNYVIDIDEDKSDGLFAMKGGLGSGIGNVLVYDEQTKLLKFNADPSTLRNNANSLFTKLTSKLGDLHQYRFKVTVKNIPKASFDYVDDRVAQDFLNALVFYTGQGNESDIENILKSEIEDVHSFTHNSRLKSDAIFLNYHDKIQKWWMKANIAAYFTEKTDIYQQCVDDIVNLLNLTSNIYINKIKTLSLKYNTEAIKMLKFVNKFQGTAIVTDFTLPTVMKLIQCLQNHKFIAIDLTYVLDMLINEFNSLMKEISKINTDTNIIIIADSSLNSKIRLRLKKIATAVLEKNFVIITNKLLYNDIAKYFPNIDKLYHDLKHSFVDLTHDSQQKLSNNTKIIFQNEQVNLCSIIDNVSSTFIENAEFNDVLTSKPIEIGQPLDNPSYNKIKHLHVDRRVHIEADNTQDNEINIKTLHDLNKDVVIITAEPGMGKSTLLTNLSLKTKEIDISLWIVRINLREDVIVKQFYKWKHDNVVLDSVQVVTFLCLNSLKNTVTEDIKTLTIYEKNDLFYVETRTQDEWTSFELKMFIHLFNKGKMMFLFDGFDEICPNYMREAVLLLQKLKAFNPKLKMWITTRPYNEIKSILKESFGPLYELSTLFYDECGIYLEKKWQSDIDVNKMSDVQEKNIHDFMLFMERTMRAICDKEDDTYENWHQLLNFPLLIVFSKFEMYVRERMKQLFTENLFLDQSTLSIESPQFYDVVKTCKEYFENPMEFLGNPLHLNLIAQYLIAEINGKRKTRDEWQLGTNTNYTIHERFWETKLKKIRFEEKNKICMYNPDLMASFEEMTDKSKAAHKKIAAAVYFGETIFSTTELEEVIADIKKIEIGGEKTGIIRSVSNGIPEFIHSSFAKYFAIEYIIDMLRNVDKNSEVYKQLTYQKDNELSPIQIMIIHGL